MTRDSTTAGAAWLGLREPADCRARSTDLVDQVRRHLPEGGRSVIHDLGCGTGSMTRWLAPRLPGPQHWVMYDQDADLLARAAASLSGVRSDGAAVTVETREGDVTRLGAHDVAGASLITVSALLDTLTDTELDRLVVACADAACPVLLTLTVTGQVDLTPADPLDDQLRHAFNAHQRRTARHRPFLGPDAAVAAVDAFRRLGSEVLVRPSPWQLGAGDGALTSAWLGGWVGAAREQQPNLDGEAGAYLRRRSGQASDGRLRITVHHDDLLVLPR